MVGGEGLPLPLPRDQASTPVLWRRAHGHPKQSASNSGRSQICPRWNRLQPWFELVGAFKDAA